MRFGGRGDSWTHLPGLGNADVASLATQGRTIYAGAYGSPDAPRPTGVFRSEDGGDSWAPVSEGLAGSTPGVLAVVGTTVYVETEEGLFSTEPGRTFWTAVPSPGSDRAFLVGASETSLFVLGPPRRLYRSRAR